MKKIILFIGLSFQLGAMKYEEKSPLLIQVVRTEYVDPKGDPTQEQMLRSSADWSRDGTLIFTTFMNERCHRDSQRLIKGYLLNTSLTSAISITPYIKGLITTSHGDPKMYNTRTISFFNEYTKMPDQACIYKPFILLPSLANFNPARNQYGVSIENTEKGVCLYKIEEHPNKSLEIREASIVKEKGWFFTWSPNGRIMGLINKRGTSSLFSVNHDTLATHPLDKINHTLSTKVISMLSIDATNKVLAAIEYTREEGAPSRKNVVIMNIKDGKILCSWPSLECITAVWHPHLPLLAVGSEKKVIPRHEPKAQATAYYVDLRNIVHRYEK